MEIESFVCENCGSTYPAKGDLMLCQKCGYPLLPTYNLDLLSEFEISRLESRPTYLWRYRELLPSIKDENVVSLMEGYTPVVKSEKIKEEFGLRDLKFKLEYVNPTGSLKDRGSTLLISWLKQIGIKSIADDSSGNAGASIAAYSSRAGIECTIYVPENTPKSKIAQTLLYGAKIIEVLGGRTRTAERILKKMKEGRIYYASHNMSPFFLEGFKTFAYEIIDQLKGEVPDHIILPVGGGTLFLGAYRGFSEAKEIGWIDQLPKLHIVQPEACNPIVRAYERRSELVEPVKEGETIAGGLKIANPPRGRSVMRALFDCGGAAVSVREEEILEGYRSLAGEGIFAEPTSATVIPALRKLIEDGLIGRDESVLLPITGFGLKDLKSAVKVAEELRRVERLKEEGRKGSAS